MHYIMYSSLCFKLCILCKYFCVEKHTKPTLLNHSHLCLQDILAQEPVLMFKDIPRLSRTVVSFQFSATKKTKSDFCLGQTMPCNTMFIYCRRMKNQIYCKQKVELMDSGFLGIFNMGLTWFFSL